MNKPAYDNVNDKNKADKGYETLENSNERKTL